MATVAIIGAGIAGLSAARALVADGHEAIVFERATHPGGRVATRFIGGVELPRMGTVDLAFDHGAQVPSPPAIPASSAWSTPC